MKILKCGNCGTVYGIPYTHYADDVSFRCKDCGEGKVKTYSVKQK